MCITAIIQICTIQFSQLQGTKATPIAVLQETLYKIYIPNNDALQTQHV